MVIHHTVWAAAEARKFFYHPKTMMGITEVSAEVDLQALVSHSLEMFSKVQTEICLRKWQQVRHITIFNIIRATPTSGDNPGGNFVLWKNPQPSSTGQAGLSNCSISNSSYNIGEVREKYEEQTFKVCLSYLTRMDCIFWITAACVWWAINSEFATLWR